MTALAEAFRHQSRACTHLGSPFMGQLCNLLADRLAPTDPLRSRLFDWSGDLGPSGESLPLRLCGALHALHLQGCDALAPVYPPQKVQDDTLWAAIDAALTQHAAFIDAFINSAPQTNEVRRSVALIAAGHWLTQRHNLPIVTRELGASGGLNLHWDSYGLATPQGNLGAPNPALTLSPDWSGPLPTGPAPQVTERKGVDLNPLDPTQPQDALRLRAYLWPDQPDRAALTQAAIATLRPAEVDKGDAITWLRDHLTPQPGHTRLIYHTIAWQYFPAQSQTQGRALIEAAGASATQDSPLAWLAMEADAHTPGAGLRLRLWPGNETHDLARVDFHGRWIDWRA